MTYGWALILIATVIGVLVFIVSTPVSEVVFSSSEPNKIMLKGGTVSGTTVEIRLQNITGGNITVTDADAPESFGTCSLNDESLPISSPTTVLVTAGGPIDISCTDASDPSGTVEITYDDFANLTRTVGIIAGGSSATPTPPPCSGPCQGDLSYCDFITDEQLCSDQGCDIWVPGGECQGTLDPTDNCTVLENQEDCDNASSGRCTWNVTCTDVPGLTDCMDLTTDSACLSTMNCYWGMCFHTLDDTPQPGCSGITDETLCNNYTSLTCSYLCS